MKRFLAIVLALALVLAMSTTALAATTSTISVTNANAGETYQLYKIFDAVESADASNISYTMASTSPWEALIDAYAYDLNNDGIAEDIFTLTPSAADATVLIVTYPAAFNTDAAGADLAAYLAKNIGSIAADQTVVANDAKVATFESLTLGYYFVTTSTGSLCAIDTNNSSVVIAEKNDYPSVEKEADKPSASIGETVTFKLTLTVPATADKPVTVHDKMEGGFTFNNDVSAKIGDTPVAFTSKTPTDGCLFELEFAAADVAGKTITIIYTAEVDQDAEIVGETETAEQQADGIITDGKNTNTSWVTYSAYVSPESSVDVLTYEMTLIKVIGDTEEPLAGVQFELYDAAGNIIKFAGGTNGVYRVADDTQVSTATTTLVTPASGVIEVEGLAPGAYTLKETATVDGFNPLATDVTIVIGQANNYYAFAREATEDQAAVAENNVIRNYTGSELPSTGGIGTTIFYVIGGLLMVGAAVVLITRKKMSSGEN